MNLKHIDAALVAYRNQLDQADWARLTFFRKLWGVQDAISTQAAEGAYSVPPTDTLLEVAQEEQPILSYAAYSVDAEVLAVAVERICAVLLEEGGFAEATCKQLAQVKWDRLIAASQVSLAGSNPASYVEAMDRLLRDDGLHEDGAALGAQATSLALRALLEKPALAVAQALQQTEILQKSSLNCPVCGGQAVLARVGATQDSQGSGKELWCSQCGTAWSFERLRCGRCGTQNQSHLHFFNIEGDEAHRLATCDECGGYVRSVYQSDALAPFAFEVEDVVMAKLDLLAYQQAQAQEHAEPLTSA